MRKNIFLLATTTLFSILFLSAIASAYGYYDDSFSSTSYSKTTTQGSTYGPTYTTKTNYNKETDSIYLGNGGYVKTTSYTKTETRSPDYYGYGPAYLRNRYYYGSYYPKSSYTDYNAYYPQNIDYNSWNYRPEYTYESYGSGNRYGWDYYYKPTYTGYYNWRY